MFLNTAIRVFIFLSSLMDMVFTLLAIVLSIRAFNIFNTILTTINSMITLMAFPNIFSSPYSVVKKSCIYRLLIQTPSYWSLCALLPPLSFEILNIPSVIKLFFSIIYFMLLRSSRLNIIASPQLWLISLGVGMVLYCIFSFLKTESACMA